MKKSTSWLVCSVVAAHALAICLVLLIQGCGTTTTGPRTRPAVVTPQEVPMPERAHSERPVPTRVTTFESRPKPAWEPQTKTYVVQKGDTLSLIASRFNVTVAQVLALNNLDKPDVIRIGQKLKLPTSVNLNAPPPKPKTAAKPKPKTDVAGARYVVKPGDTLSQIAVDHGVTVKVIQDANAITGHLIYAGQALTIPGAKKSAAQTASEATPAVATAAEESAAADSSDQPDADPLPDVEVSEAADVLPEPDPVSDAAEETVIDDVPLTMHTHEVKAGEDLYSVSLIWDVSIEELKRVNGLSGTDLTTGQILRIPRPQ